MYIIATTPGLGASYTIRPGNRVGLFYTTRTHMVDLHHWLNLSELSHKS